MVGSIPLVQIVPNFSSTARVISSSMRIRLVKYSRKGRLQLETGVVLLSLAELHLILVLVVEGDKVLLVVLPAVEVDHQEAVAVAVVLVVLLVVAVVHHRITKSRNVSIGLKSLLIVQNVPLKS